MIADLLDVPKPAATTLAKSEWRRRLFTREEYYRLGEQGFFGKERIQLIEGEIVEMPSQSNIHALGIALLSDALTTACGPNFWVRIQMPIDLNDSSAPEPDIAVVAGNMRSFIGKRENPIGAVLIVEVSESTLSADRKWMASLYAKAGIEDYWILNLPARVIEVRRDPQPDPDAVFAFNYGTVVVHKVGEFVSPLSMPDARIAVADVMPN